MDFKGSSPIVSVVAVLAVIMALQTTVICIVVVFVACRHGRKKGTQKMATEGVLEMEDQLYEAVEAEGSKPSHRGREMHFQENDSYAIN